MEQQTQPENKPEVKEEKKDRKVRSAVTYRFSKTLMEDFKEEPDIEESYKVRVVEYDRSGNVTREIELDEDEQVSEMYERSYDSKGNMTEMKHYYEQELAESTAYTYNSKGNLEKEVLRYADGSETVTHYAYDADNNLVEKKTLDPEGNLEARDTYAYSGKNVTEHCTYNTENELQESTRYVYDSEGKLREELNYQREHDLELRTVYLDGEAGTVTYNREGKVHSRQRLVRDEKKRVTENILEVFNGRYHYRFVYDEQDNLVSEERQLNNNIYFKVVNKWGEAGLLLMRSVTDVNSGFFSDVYKYEFWD
ncbi:MAG: hypothetical protein AB1458_08320 [Bacteroidota bacterium]